MSSIGIVVFLAALLSGSAVTPFLEVGWRANILWDFWYPPLPGAEAGLKDWCSLKKKSVIFQFALLSNWTLLEYKNSVDNFFTAREQKLDMVPLCPWVTHFNVDSRVWTDTQCFESERLLHRANKSIKRGKKRLSDHKHKQLLGEMCWFSIYHPMNPYFIIFLEEFGLTWEKMTK